MKTLKIKSGLQNRYHVQVVDAQTGAVKQEETFHNTVTDYWAEGIMSTFQTSGSKTAFIVGLGVGSGTHQSSDTQLFQALWHSSYIAWKDTTLFHEANSASYSLSFSISLTENQGNGLLTELSISESWSGDPGNCVNPICLANFQDAEGHTISIEKTDTDVLILDIEFQLTLDTSNLPSNVHINLSGKFMEYFPDPPVGRYQSDPTLMGEFSQYPGDSSYIYGTIASWMLPYRNDSARLSLNTNKGMGFSGGSYGKSGSWTSETIGQDKVYRATFSDVALSSEANLPDATEPYQIMSLGFLLDSCCLGIDFPDHDIFPPTEIEFQLEGDGSTTDFNLSVPVLMTNPAPEVSIDNQIISSGYTWYGINWNTIQPWIVTDWNNVMSYSRDNDYQTTKLQPTTPYSWSGRFTPGATELIYDFGTAVSIDCVGRLSTRYVDTTASIEYSLDYPYSWVAVKTWANAAAGSGLEHLSTPIIARYWRIVSGLRYQSRPTETDPQKIGMPVIGDWATVTKPTIRFDTAPGIGSVIKIKAYTEYPVKTSDWIYRTISLDISKGALNQ